MDEDEDEDDGAEGYMRPSSMASSISFAVAKPVMVWRRWSVFVLALAMPSAQGGGGVV